MAPTEPGDGREESCRCITFPKIRSRIWIWRRQLVKDEDFETLELLFEGVPFVFSQLIRTTFVPSPGCRFVVSDFSAIEARVTAWLADEQWRLDVFNGHGKIYEASAAQMFHVPIESVKKGSKLRQQGKVAELALGYGGGFGAMKKMDKAGTIRMTRSL